MNGYKIKGKGYDGADNLLFVLNSNGKEKEYNYDGNVIFEGNIIMEKDGMEKEMIVTALLLMN